MAKALKQMLAAELGVELENSPAGLMVVDPGGMTVETVEAFRGDLREKAGGARMRVIHNRTARVEYPNRPTTARNESKSMIGSRCGNASTMCLGSPVHPNASTNGRRQ